MADPDLQIRGGGGGGHPVPEISGALRALARAKNKGAPGSATDVIILKGTRGHYSRQSCINSEIKCHDQMAYKGLLVELPLFGTYWV